MNKLTLINVLLLASALGMAGCSTSDDDADLTVTGSTDTGVQRSCVNIDVAALQNTGGVFSTVLPADLSVSGSQIQLLNLPAGQFTAFDALTGTVDFVPGSSRLSSVVEYQVVDASGIALSTYEHRWVLSPVRVMPLGDSITSGVEFFDGTDLPPMPQRVGYRKFLYDQLSADGYAIDYHGQGGQAAGAEAGLIDPENNGYPGVDIDFLNGKLIEQLTEDKVDIVLLHIGTNNTPQSAQGIDDWLDQLDEWESSNQPVLALVATIVPKRDVGLNAVVNQFNADLKVRIAAREDDLVVLVDQNAVVGLSDISDEQIGLHPNAGGYQKMADAWSNVLVNADSSADFNALYRCDD